MTAPLTRRGECVRSERRDPRDQDGHREDLLTDRDIVVRAFAGIKTI